VRLSNVFLIITFNGDITQENDGNDLMFINNDV